MVQNAFLSQKCKLRLGLFRFMELRSAAVAKNADVGDQVSLMKLDLADLLCGLRLE
jgi:hypothetical protein